MNPVAHFETNARRIWTSRVSPDQKARQLTELSDRIAAYLSRLEELPPERRQNDEWVKAAVDRARKYLEALATDVRHLALNCREVTTN
ncbi:MAG: hypothetical protein BGO01_13360 [Armatimonadetes bacterium 55-13]|nr:hypothetical protein [Armatimonadota bacterium]OJU61898.1 MAG: hypothetical protein BGO01_13360 [Armatimonadetes bacterium 55-13]